MKYAYTAEPVEGFTQLNPKFWPISTPRSDAAVVIVDVGFDEIAEHYRDAGAEVEVRDAQAEYDIPATPGEVSKLKVDHIKDLLEAHGVEDPKGKKDDLIEQLTKVMFVGGV